MLILLTLCHYAIIIDYYCHCSLYFIIFIDIFITFSLFSFYYFHAFIIFIIVYWYYIDISHFRHIITLIITPLMPRHYYCHYADYFRYQLSPHIIFIIDILILLILLILPRHFIIIIFIRLADIIDTPFHLADTITLLMRYYYWWLLLYYWYWYCIIAPHYIILILLIISIFHYSYWLLPLFRAHWDISLFRFHWLCWFRHYYHYAIITPFHWFYCHIIILLLFIIIDIISLSTRHYFITPLAIIKCQLAIDAATLLLPLLLLFSYYWYAIIDIFIIDAMPLFRHFIIFAISHFIDTIAIIIDFHW